MAKAAPAAREPGRRLTLDEDVPQGVAVYRISGPFFFGASWRLQDALARIGYEPRVFILDLGQVPFVDATGANVLAELVRDCRRRGGRVFFTGAGREIRRAIRAMGLVGRDRAVRFVPSLERALELVRAPAAGG